MVGKLRLHAWAFCRAVTVSAPCIRLLCTVNPDRESHPTKRRFTHPSKSGIHPDWTSNLSGVPDSHAVMKFARQTTLLADPAAIAKWRPWSAPLRVAAEGSVPQ